MSAIATASAEMVEAIRAAREAGEPERRRRLLLQVIDLAVDLCERLNLAAPYWRPAAEVPAWVAELLGQPAADTVEAHGLLMDLRARYMAISPVSPAEEIAWLAGDEVWLAGQRRGWW
jgi:hypothetical protein